MLEKGLAAIAIGGLIVLTNAGPPRSSTKANGSGPSLRPADGLGVWAVGTPSFRQGADSARKGLSKTAADRVALTQAALRELKTDWMDTFIPDGAVALLTSLKHQLRDA